jgi:serine/threonine protein kinase
MAELAQTPEAGREAVVLRYQREFPEHQAAIRDLVEVDAGVRPPVSADVNMIQVAEAVQHGHDRGICHRDIKPSNLIIDPSEVCWVIDYGLAGVVNGPSSKGAPPTEDQIDGKLTFGPVGTPQYMAPEQFDGQTDERSDVWSLGVTLYELLTLRPAFRADGWAGTKELVTQTEPEDPRKLVRNVPSDLAAICRKAMAKDPAQRYPSARAFAEDVRCIWERGRWSKKRSRT